MHLSNLLKVRQLSSDKVRIQNHVVWLQGLRSPLYLIAYDNSYSVHVAVSSLPTVLRLQSHSLWEKDCVCASTVALFMLFQCLVRLGAL